MPALYGASLITADGEELILDATLSVEPSTDADVTSYEVEAGIEVAEHVRPKPLTLNLSGILTDTPGYEAPAEGRASVVLARLGELQRAATPLSVASGFEVWSSLIITSLKATRSASVGRAWEVSLTLQELRIATTATVEVPASLLKPKVANKAPATTDQGDQAAGAASPEAGQVAQRKSTLKGAVDALGGLLGGG